MPNILDTALDVLRGYGLGKGIWEPPRANYEEDDDFEGIPDFGPYVIPKEAILAALRSGKPFDIEDYRDMSIPDDAVF